MANIGVHEDTEITGCEIVNIPANHDHRGVLYEIFRQSWPGMFPVVQWNACTSSAGVVRGAHVHTYYHEFYALLRGRAIVGLADIRRTSPTFRRCVQFDWSDRDGRAVIVPPGVAHVLLFEADSVLAVGLSDYWQPEHDDIGCRWDDPALGFIWPRRAISLSERDLQSGSYQTMVGNYEERRRAGLASGPPVLGCAER